jgi:hypothetical protein
MPTSATLIGMQGGRPSQRFDQFDFLQRLSATIGMQASRATSVGEFATQFASAMKHRGPRLIESSCSRVTSPAK